jgi:hypothetical protein
MGRLSDDQYDELYRRQKQRMKEDLVPRPATPVTVEELPAPHIGADRRPPSPQFLVLNSRRPFDDTDARAADVCATIKRRGDRFESDQELSSWLDEDQVNYDPERFGRALSHLESIGRIKRPRQDQWSAEWPLPGTYVEPRVHVEIF